MSLALDGRCRNFIASAGISGPGAHTGSLYWLVTKTNEPKEATLDLETMQYEQRIKVNIPGFVICYISFITCYEIFQISYIRCYML